MNTVINPAVLPKSCVALLETIHSVDISDEAKVKLADAANAVAEDATRRRRILSLVQEALGQLRLDMKYLMFDLEATRRERDEALEKI